MNEIDMNETARVRRLLGEPPPPSAEASARALARLEDAMAPGGKRVRPSRTGRRRFGRPVQLGAGLVAAGVAAAVAIVVTGQGSPGSPPDAPPGALDLGRQAVLVAADKAAEQPTGNYWSAERISGQAYVVRARTGTYAIFGAHDETFNWAGARKGMGEAYYARDLPARPQTPEDEALWRKAGSPSAIRVWSNDHYFTTPPGRRGGGRKVPRSASTGRGAGRSWTSRLRSCGTCRPTRPSSPRCSWTTTR